MYFAILITILCGLSGARNQRGSQKLESESGATENYRDDTKDYFDTNKDLSASDIRLAFQNFKWTSRHDKEKPVKKNVTLNTVESFWSMYHHGNLQDASDSQTVLSCTENNIPQVDKNQFLGHANVENIQTWTEKLHTYPIVFGNVILNKVAKLSENLLPHEFIQLLVRIFSVSKEIFLVDSSIDSLMQSYFEAIWPRPKELVEEVCKAGKLMCYDIKQIQVWNEERFVLQVTIKNHQRQLHPHFCVQYQQGEDCYLEYSLNNTKVINQQNITLVENINDNYIPLDILLYHTVISEKCLEELLIKLLKKDLFDNDIRNIMLDGEYITYHSNWNGERQQDHEVNWVKTHVLKKTGTIKIPNEIITAEINKPSLINDSGPQVRTGVGKIQQSYYETIKDITDTVLTREEKQVQLGLLYLTESFEDPTRRAPRLRYRLQGIKPVTSKSQNNLKLRKRINDTFPLSSIVEKLQENRVLPGNNSNTIPLNHIEPNLRVSRNSVLNVLKNKVKLREKDLNTSHAPRPIFKKRNLLSISKHTKNSINRFLKSRKLIPGGERYSSHKSRKSSITNQKDFQNSGEEFDKLWSMVRKDIPHILGHTRKRDVLIYGEEAYCMLSCKLSMVYPLASIITIVPQQDNFKKCLNMGDNLPHRSNLVFHTKLDSSLINQIYSLPQMLDLQILGMDILTNMITTGHGFLLYLGKLLTQAKTTILELPSVYHLQQALDIVAQFKTIDHNNTTGIKYSVQGMIHQALQIVQADYYPVKIFNSRSYNNSIVLIQLNSFNKKIQTNCKGTDSSIMKYNYNSGVIIDQDLLQPGISLQYILILKLHPVARSSLFKEYLKLPIIRDMCPINILWSNQTLIHRQLQLQVDDISIIQQRVDDLKSEIKDEQFLFIDFNNNDYNKMTT
ncbi:hypothetical protein LOTGIDRAFT_151996 [Lottia gigantea]|uniref:Uncharacterized protein n=1 Tax=Lottia gigantea TaxID=225164 RepID=V4B416_LOTGI|nr:hypothetical protein LOTGIDRAFT_151996 [Lottia gigantea]ESP05188.1 hypothetical protein LOTGIDRAFT_151996 [Lottia gigantea]